MASEQQVKQYLAYWFQLGKKLLIRGGQEAILPQAVIQGENYSQEFEKCWQQILALKARDCYLEGTDQTIAKLLTPAWEILPCGRCQMPVPVDSVGMPPLDCPCYDLPTWPNREIPAPRMPINSQDQLKEIHNRLLEVNSSKTS